jgi:hypothetical protein
MDIRNVGILTQHYTASQPRRPRLVWFSFLITINVNFSIVLMERLSVVKVRLVKFMANPVYSTAYFVSYHVPFIWLGFVLLGISFSRPRVLAISYHLECESPRPSPCLRRP